MPEQLKPCPACGETPIINADSGHVICCKIVVDDVDCWNQLPRALRWTTEPPTVAGWYWMGTNSKIDHVANAEKKNCGGVYEIMPVKIIDGRACYDMKFEDSPIVIDTEIFEWAGPIDAPE